jgi:prepilin-type N-terminal cleavage/methylation domain-containing protein
MGKIFKPSRAVTLTELLVTIIIVGILASLAVVGYTRTIERMRRREAFEVLYEIAAAERLYYRQTGKLSGDENIVLMINYQLGLEIHDSPDWKYCLDTADDNNYFVVYARKITGYDLNRVWSINMDMSNGVLPDIATDRGVNPSLCP